MKFKFEDIEMAYDFVSSSSYGMNSAVLRKTSQGAVDLQHLSLIAMEMF